MSRKFSAQESQPPPESEKRKMSAAKVPLINVTSALGALLVETAVAVSQAVDRSYFRQLSAQVKRDKKLRKKLEQEDKIELSFLDQIVDQTHHTDEPEEKLCV